jgi:hypothetical protein
MENFEMMVTYYLHSKNIHYLKFGEFKNFINSKYVSNSYNFNNPLPHNILNKVVHDIVAYDTRN